MNNKYVVDGGVTKVYINCLGKEHVVLIDTADLPIVDSIKGKWYGRLNADKRIYVVYSFDNTTISMHRLLMGNPIDKLVDHIHHDTLDNRRSNLREADIELNSQNREGAQSNSASGIRGVSWHSKHNKWKTKVSYKRKDYSFGYYHNLLDATMAVVAGRNQLYKPEPVRVPIKEDNNEWIRN